MANFLELDFKIKRIRLVCLIKLIIQKQNFVREK